MNRAAIALVALAVACLISLSTVQHRKLIEPLRDRVEGRDRYVDAGIALHVVVADPDGVVLVPGGQPMRILRTHRAGGMIDTAAVPAVLCGPSRDPVQWYCSEDQEPVILHRDVDPLGLQVYGSEGSGKTTALAMWHAFRWLEHLGEERQGGQTAPTAARLGLVRAEMFKLWRPTWFRYRASKEVFEMCDGTTVMLVSTYRQSAEGGSPIQGWNWSWAGRDEGQDQVEVHEDIESRGRAARIVNGDPWYKQLVTCTSKNSSSWRTLRDKMLAAKMPDGRPQWMRRMMIVARSPFVAPNFVAIKASSMSSREFRRRMLAEDLPPENATYPEWSREHNLITVPSVGWVDVTAHELSRWGHNLHMLGGHDPGAMWDVTELLKAYRPNNPAGLAAPRPFWVVVDEVTTERSTTEQHVSALLDRVRRRWHINQLGRDGQTTADGPRLYVRADPYGNNDSKPDRQCYTVFRNAGVKVEPAAYSETGTGPGRVPLDAGIEVVNMLLCNAREERRLFVARNPDGSPVAPKLVDALESEERDYHGKAEARRKDRKDTSHWPAALRYGVWQIERPRLQNAGAR